MNGQGGAESHNRYSLDCVQHTTSALESCFAERDEKDIGLTASRAMTAASQ